jgi:hypothetical protein
VRVSGLGCLVVGGIKSTDSLKLMLLDRIRQKGEETLSRSTILKHSNASLLAASTFHYHKGIVWLCCVGLGRVVLGWVGLVFLTLSLLT